MTFAFGFALGVSLTALVFTGAYLLIKETLA